MGPTRIDLTPQHPVAVLEVQNTGEYPTLVQIDTFVWSQSAGNESLEATTDLLATPLILNLSRGETQSVRVGLREPIVATVEQSYRVVVGEVEPTLVASTGLRFAVRISAPVFARAAEQNSSAGKLPEALSWTVRPGMEGCERILVDNSSSRHEHVLHAELLAANGDLLWQSGAPDYILAEARRSLSAQVCAPSSSGSAALRLTTESRTITLPPAAAAMLVDEK